MLTIESTTYFKSLFFTKFCEDYNINQNRQIANPKKETNNLSKGTQL